MPFSFSMTLTFIAQQTLEEFMNICNLARNNLSQIMFREFIKCKSYTIMAFVKRFFIRLDSEPEFLHGTIRTTVFAHIFLIVAQELKDNLFSFPRREHLEWKPQLT